MKKKDEALEKLKTEWAKEKEKLQRQVTAAGTVGLLKMAVDGGGEEIDR
jgi:hypothetical protein